MKCDSCDEHKKFFLHVTLWDQWEDDFFWAYRKWCIDCVIAFGDIAIDTPHQDTSCPMCEGAEESLVGRCPIHADGVGV